MYTITILNNNRILKVALCILLCLLTITLSYVQQYNEAHASGEALYDLMKMLQEKGILVVGALLAAAGLTLTAESGMDYITDKFVNWAGDSVLPALQEMYNNAAAGVMNVNDFLWNKARNFAKTYNVGQNTVNPDYVIQNGTRINVGDSTATQTGIVMFDNKLYSAVCDGVNKTYGTYKVDYWHLNRGTDNFMDLTVAAGSTVKLEVSYNATTRRESLFLYRVYYYEPGVKRSELAVITLPDPLPIPSIIVNGQNSLTNNSFDIKKNGVRIISIPNTYQDLVNKEWSDLVPNHEEISNFPESWDGTFKSASPYVSNYDWIFNPTSTTINTTGHWVGVWDSLSTGEKTFTGTIEGSQVIVTQKPSPTPVPSPTPQPTMKPMIPLPIDHLPKIWIGDFEDSDPDQKANPSPESKPYIYNPPEVEGETGTWTGEWREKPDGQRQFTGQLTKPNGTVVPNVQVTGGPVNDNPDLTDEATDWNLPDMFLLLLNVILATIRMVSRAIIFIATLYSLPADSSDIPINMILGLNFLKDFQIPIINTSFWTIFMAVMTFMYSIFCFKLIVKWVTKKA